MPDVEKSSAEVGKCSECGKEFKNSFGLLRHKKTHQVCECEFCGKMFKKPASLKQHYLIHMGEKSYKCEFCRKRFDDKSHLLKHMKFHDDGIPPPIHVHKCLECGKEFKSSPALDNHKNTHKVHKCHICGKTCSHISGLRTHYVVHTGEKPFPCEVCDKYFNTKGAVTGHRRIHENWMNSPVQLRTCSTCGKEFKSYSGLMRHENTHSENPKALECEFCHKIFSLKSVLKTHYMIHTGEKPFACDTCRQRFRHKYQLIKHMRIHAIGFTGEVFKCFLCRQDFTSSVLLWKHKLSHFKTERSKMFLETSI